MAETNNDEEPGGYLEALIKKFTRKRKQKKIRINEKGLLGDIKKRNKALKEAYDMSGAAE